MIMKGYILFFIAFTAVMAQRPPYAGSSPKGRPELASRFKETNAESSSQVSLNNRVGDETTIKIPVDARGDADLVNRLNQWPREHRPFWLLNADHIEQSRHPQGGSSNTNGVQQTVSTQNRFGEQYDNRNYFGGSDDYQRNIDLQSRSDFDSDYFDSPVQSRPARPAQSRPFFSGSAGVR